MKAILLNVNEINFECVRKFFLSAKIPMSNRVLGLVAAVVVLVDGLWGVLFTVSGICLNQGKIIIACCAIVCVCVCASHLYNCIGFRIVNEILWIGIKRERGREKKLWDRLNDIAFGCIKHIFSFIFIFISILCAPAHSRNETM